MSFILCDYFFFGEHTVIFDKTACTTHFKLKKVQYNEIPIVSSFWDADSVIKMEKSFWGWMKQRLTEMPTKAKFNKMILSSVRFLVIVAGLFCFNSFGFQPILLQWVWWWSSVWIIFMIPLLLYLSWIIKQRNKRTVVPGFVSLDLGRTSSITLVSSSWKKIYWPRLILAIEDADQRENGISTTAPNSQLEYKYLLQGNIMNPTVLLKLVKSKDITVLFSCKGRKRLSFQWTGCR